MPQADAASLANKRPEGLRPNCVEQPHTSLRRVNLGWNVLMPPFDSIRMKIMHNEYYV